MTKVWGHVLWLFLHTISEKIKDESFEKHKSFLSNIISSLCSTIPCYECEKDSLAYIKNHPLQRIKSKSDLKLYLFDFHNHVNKKTHKTAFELKQLEQYKKYSFIKIINLFKKYYLYYRGNTLDLSKGLQRRMVIQNIMEYINKNKNDFYI